MGYTIALEGHGLGDDSVAFLYICNGLYSRVYTTKLLYFTTSIKKIERGEDQHKYFPMKSTDKFSQKAHNLYSRMIFISLIQFIFDGNIVSFLHLKCAFYHVSSNLYESP